MILTEMGIELEVSRISGTHVKRNNLRKKLKKQSNDIINEKIKECKGKIRDLRALGAKEQSIRDWYSQVTKLEMRLL